MFFLLDLYCFTVRRRRRRRRRIVLCSREKKKRKNCVLVCWNMRGFSPKQISNPVVYKIVRKVRFHRYRDGSASASVSPISSSGKM
ncbi:hypothetical protein P8452_08594 [Trifolium repens]|nr:hypothetical protein P8452_08594 [Trifolium repens]